MHFVLESRLTRLHGASGTARRRALRRPPCITERLQHVDSFGGDCDCSLAVRSAASAEPLKHPQKGPHTAFGLIH
eukprot:60631-Prymnesium_polylepis.1